jgi:CO/xanthine dehydrogenase Mo-binding subunit
MMDHLATELQVEPAAFRKANLYQQNQVGGSHHCVCLLPYIATFALDHSHEHALDLLQPRRSLGSVCYPN